MQGVTWELSKDITELWRQREGFGDPGSIFLHPVSEGKECKEKGSETVY